VVREPGALTDVGINDRFMKDVAATLDSGNAAPVGELDPKIFVKLIDSLAHNLVLLPVLIAVAKRAQTAP